MSRTIREIALLVEAYERQFSDQAVPYGVAWTDDLGNRIETALSTGEPINWVQPNDSDAVI